MCPAFCVFSSRVPVCVYAHVCTCVQVGTCVRACMHVCACVYMCAPVCLCVPVLTRQTHSHTHAESEIKRPGFAQYLGLLWDTGLAALTLGRSPQTAKDLLGAESDRDGET